MIPESGKGEKLANLIGLTASFFNVIDYFLSHLTDQSLIFYRIGKCNSATPRMRIFIFVISFDDSASSNISFSMNACPLAFDDSFKIKILRATSTGQG